MKIFLLILASIAAAFGAIDTEKPLDEIIDSLSQNTQSQEEIDFEKALEIVDQELYASFQNPESIDSVYFEVMSNPLVCQKFKEIEQSFLDRYDLFVQNLVSALRNNPSDPLGQRVQKCMEEGDFAVPKDRIDLFFFLSLGISDYKNSADREEILKAICKSEAGQRISASDKRVAHFEEELEEYYFQEQLSTIRGVCARSDDPTLQNIFFLLQEIQTQDDFFALLDFESQTDIEVYEVIDQLYSREIQAETPFEKELIFLMDDFYDWISLFFVEMCECIFTKDM